MWNRTLEAARSFPTAEQQQDADARDYGQVIDTACRAIFNEEKGPRAVFFFSGCGAWSNCGACPNLRSAIGEVVGRICINEMRSWRVGAPLERLLPSIRWPAKRPRPVPARGGGGQALWAGATKRIAPFPGSRMTHGQTLRLMTHPCSPRDQLSVCVCVHVWRCAYGILRKPRQDVPGFSDCGGNALDATKLLHSCGHPSGAAWAVLRDVVRCQQ